MNRTDLIREGEARRDEGMERGARYKQYRIKAAQLAFLRAMRQSPDRTATMDDASDPQAKFADGGKWRGSVPKGLRDLVKKDGVTLSIRPSHHRGYVTVWRGKDDAAIDAKIAELERWLDDNHDLAESTPEQNELVEEGINP